MLLRARRAMMNAPTKRSQVVLDGPTLEGIFWGSGFYSPSCLTKSTVNAVISKRFAKRQQMQWTSHAFQIGTLGTVVTTRR